MSYERCPPQASPTGYTLQNTLLYPQNPPPQHLEANHFAQNHLCPFCKCYQMPSRPCATLMGLEQQPTVYPGTRLATDPYHQMPRGASHSDLLDYSSSGLESLRFFPPPTHLTPMQPNFPPIFTGYFLCFDQNCKYLQQRDSEPSFTGLKYPQNYHTFRSGGPPYPTMSGGINATTAGCIGDPCSTVAGNFSLPALPIWGSNTDSLIDTSPVETFSTGNPQPYSFNPPPTSSGIQELGIRINDTNPPNPGYYDSYPSTTSIDTRASRFEPNASSNAPTRTSGPLKFPNRNTHMEMDSIYKGVISRSEPSTLKYTRNNGFDNIGSFKNPLGNTRRSRGPAIFVDNNIGTSLYEERIALNTLSDHSQNRACNDGHRKNPRTSNLHTNVSSRNQVSEASSNLNTVPVEGENYASMLPPTPRTYTMATHPAGNQKTTPDKDTRNTRIMEANTNDAATEVLVSSFNPLDPATPNPTAGSSPSIKFKAYKCCNCNTSHYEPFTSDQDICYNCNHTVCRACYNFWECCNCNTLGRFSNHTCDECKHEKCPRKCLFQIITKEAWLRAEALRATENRGTFEQQWGERMHKLGRMGDSGKIPTGGRSGGNGLAKINFKPGTVGEKEEALKSLVSLREKVKASSKCQIASEPLPSTASSHHQDQRHISPADVCGSLVTSTTRMSSDPGEDAMCCGTPMKGHENSNMSTAQSPRGSNVSSNTSHTTSPSTLAGSPETPLESPTCNHSHPSRTTTLILRSAPGQGVESAQVLPRSEGRRDPKEPSLSAL
ncbi:hypothetical protein HOY80DRAFT_1023101 [Tuber brumale]|nr:hypothetical protein HOY80DRAFT_1023101 [Tuber brumale]